MATEITILQSKEEGVIQAGDKIKSSMHGVLSVVSVNHQENSITCKPKRGEMLIKFCDLIIQSQWTAQY